MSNKNDRWSALSMKERADLMNMYITNGISELKEMKKHYNSFGNGGDTDDTEVQIPTTNIVTTDNYQEKLDEFNQYRQQAITAFDSYNWDTYRENLNKSDSLGRELAKYTLNEYEKYKGSPLNKGTWAGTSEAKEPEDINFLLRSNIREDGKDVTEWLKSYVNSEGFDRVRKNQESWWKKRHPYQKILFPIFNINNNNDLNHYQRDISNYADKMLNYVLDGYTEMSFSRPYEGSTFTFKPKIKEDKELPFAFTQMHEFDHLFNDTASSYKTINFEAMKQNTNTEKGHDSYSNEKHSDIIGLKYLLYKEGIYDARGGNDITPEQIGELRKKYPKLRPLVQMDDEKAAWMLNHVAQNTSDKDRLDYINPENIAANGGKLNSFSGEEDTQISDENTKQSKDFLFRWYNNPTTRAIMNKAFPFEKVEPYYNHEGKEFTGESAVRGHIANAIYHTPEYIEKLEDSVGGRYIHDLRNPHIKYNENYVYNNDKVDPRIATHELTHALQYALPQNTLRTSKPVKQELKKGVVPDEYLDSMTEIGARINSFRNALNLTPEKRDYSPEDAETLMNTYIERFGEDATSKLNRFTPETLAGYLNYLAYNDKDVIPTFDSDVNYASNGGRLNVFSGEEDANKKPFFDPQKIVDNVPAREWGPQIVLGENDYLVKPGTNMLAAPIQYYADKNTGKQNIETANKIISDFESSKDKQRHIDDETDTYFAYLDALHYLNHAEALKKYLGLPYDTNRLKESNYKPTRLQGSDEKVYKFSNEEDPKYWGSVVNDMLLGNHNERQYIDGTLNTFTAYRDFDDKGDFISIYDEWDYNPSVQGGFKPLNKIIDIATGGKPFIVYDRIYLDDYYDVPEAFRGNPYIAPAILTDTNAYMSVDYADGGKILNTNKFSGTEQFLPKNLQQNNLMPANAGTAFLQSVINTDQKIWPGQITSEDRLSPTEKAWKAANLQYEKFLNNKKQLETYITGEDNSELITITAPNTDISKFIFNNQISKNAIQEINRVALLRKQDPYDILAHMLIESSGIPLTTTEYYNTHNVIDKQINPRYLNYYYDDREKQLKQFGIYQEGKEHTSEELEKAMSKFNKQRSETLKKVIKPESSIDAVALYMMLNGRDFNPAQKGSLTTGGVVKNSYLDMIDSAVFSLKKNMPDLFK